MSETIRGIYVWKVHPNKEEEFVRRWKLNSEVFQTYPGALGTKLHKSLTDPNIFAGYASWESLEARTAASEKMAIDHPELKDHSTKEVSEVIYSGFFYEPNIIINPTNIP